VIVDRRIIASRPAYAARLRGDSAGAPGRLIAVTLTMLGPAMLGVVIVQGGLGSPLTPDLEYLAGPAIFLGLWVFSHFDQVRPLGQVCP